MGGLLGAAALRQVRLIGGGEPPTRSESGTSSTGCCSKTSAGPAAGRPTRDSTWTDVPTSSDGSRLRLTRGPAETSRAAAGRPSPQNL
jgi:hypothetical protein